MLNFFSGRMNNKKGFTLIELIVVIAILAILALIAIPRIGKFRTGAAVSSHNANVRTLESAASMYLAENGMPGGSGFTWNKGNKTDTTSGSDTIPGWGNYIAEWPKIPSGIKKADGTNYVDSDSYSVQIEATGAVTVTPKLADDDGKVASN